MGKKEEIRKIAIERIYRLFELAEEEFSKHPERSKRYVELALKIAKRNNAKMPHELKKNYCKKCHAFLKTENAEFKTLNGLMEITCNECGFTRKHSLIERKTTRKKSADKKGKKPPQSK